MVALVGKDLRIAIRERRENPEVRRIAAAEEEGARKVREAREAPFGVVMRAQVARDEGRGARAHAVLVDRPVRRLAQARMVREAEIVVAREVDEGASRHANMRPLRRIDDAAHALQVAALEIGEALGQPAREAVHRRQADSRPSAAKSASSRATSGIAGGEELLAVE